jgi:hypothetical protein
MGTIILKDKSGETIFERTTTNLRNETKDVVNTIQNNILPVDIIMTGYDNGNRFDMGSRIIGETDIETAYTDMVLTINTAKAKLNKK